MVEEGRADEKRNYATTTTTTATEEDVCFDRQLLFSHHQGHRADVSLECLQRKTVPLPPPYPHPTFCSFFLTVTRQFSVMTGTLSTFFAHANVILNFKIDLCIPLRPIPEGALFIGQWFSQSNTAQINTVSTLSNFIAELSLRTTWHATRHIARDKR